MSDPSIPAGPSTPADPTLAYEPPAYGARPTPTPFSTAYPLAGPTAHPTANPSPPPHGGYQTPFARPCPDSAGTTRPDERSWAMAAHLSGFVAAYVALGFIGPLVVLLTAGNRSPFVRRHAVEALNFNITVLVAFVVSLILTIVLVGFLMLAALAVLYLVATIAGARAADRGEDYRYPLSIRFVS